MKNILYIGNKLNKESSNISSIESLGFLLESEGYTLYYASSKRNKTQRLIEMVWLTITLNRKVDFVLIDTYSTWNFYYAFIVSQLCRMLQLKYIPILHGGNLPSRLKNNPKLCSMIFNNAYKNVSPSFYLKAEFEKYNYAVNNYAVTYIPNSIEIEKYKFKERAYKTINLLWVRSFSKIYNPKLAILVLKSLQDKGFDASLCMVGPDSDGTLKEVKKLAKKLKVDVKFTGKLTKKKWVALSKNYNVFINTTNFDNMPVSVIEAMSLGLPIVSTNVGGMPYLIKDNDEGLLVEPNNIEEMTKAIIYLFNEPKKRKLMIDNARAKVESYDWQHVKKEWFNLLK